MGIRFNKLPQEDQEPVYYAAVLEALEVYKDKCQEIPKDATPEERRTVHFPKINRIYLETIANQCEALASSDLTGLKHKYQQDIAYGIETAVNNAKNFAEVKAQANERQ